MQVSISDLGETFSIYFEHDGKKLCEHMTMVGFYDSTSSIRFSNGRHNATLPNGSAQIQPETERFVPEKKKMAIAQALPEHEDVLSWFFHLHEDDLDMFYAHVGEGSLAVRNGDLVYCVNSQSNLYFESVEKAS